MKRLLSILLMALLATTTDSVVLKPWDNTLGELTVMPGDALLMKVL